MHESEVHKQLHLSADEMLRSRQAAALQQHEILIVASTVVYAFCSHCCQTLLLDIVTCSFLTTS